MLLHVDAAAYRDLEGRLAKQGFRGNLQGARGLLYRGIPLREGDVLAREYAPLNECIALLAPALQGV
jgi:hypothetical protein